MPFFHVFWTAAFQLPICVIQHIKASCRDFLFGGSTLQKRIHTVAWDQICKPFFKKGSRDQENLRFKNDEIVFTGCLLPVVLEQVG